MPVASEESKHLIQPMTMVWLQFVSTGKSAKTVRITCEGVFFSVLDYLLVKAESYALLKNTHVNTHPHVISNGYVVICITVTAML